MGEGLMYGAYLDLEIQSSSAMCAGERIRTGVGPNRFTNHTHTILYQVFCTHLIAYCTIGNLIIAYHIISKLPTGCGKGWGPPGKCALQWEETHEASPLNIVVENSTLLKMHINVPEQRPFSGQSALVEVTD
jgi:hypothetical protein